MSEIKIRDLYTGKPDAKDEIEFTHNGESYLGQIHISEFTKLGYGYIGNLSEIVHIDDEYRTALLDYHEKYERWNLQIIPQELE